MAKSEPSGPLSGSSDPDRSSASRPSTEPRDAAPPVAQERAPRQSPADQLRTEAAARQTGPDGVDDEQVRWTGGYSPWTMLGTWVGLIVLTIAAIVGTVLASGAVPWLVTGIAVLLVWIVVASIYAARRLGVHYELTTQRFLHQSGIISRRTDRIEVIDIDDVSFVQGPVQRMLGVGTIRISSSDRSHPELVMPGIANVREVAGLIDDIRRKERRRRSLHIESI